MPNTYSYRPPSKEQENLAMKLNNLIPFAKHKNKGFISSLCDCVLKANKAWSEKQLYWAEKYYKELSEIAERGKASRQAAKEAQESLAFPNILALFKSALDKGLAYPKISYDLPTCRLVLAYSRAYSSIAIRVGNRSIGAINLYGKMDKQFPLKDEKVLACLLEVEKDPIKAAKISGKQTGSCCFCGRELTDARSVTHSYGPICAEHWGLPWDDLTKEEMKKTIVIYTLEGRTEEEIC